MKSKNLLLAVLFLFGLFLAGLAAASYCYADNLHIEFVYDHQMATEFEVETFDLYNKDQVLVAQFPSTVREGDFDYTAAGCESFYLKAAAPGRTSEMGNIYVFCPDVEKVPGVKTFTITVQEVL